MRERERERERSNKCLILPMQNNMSTPGYNYTVYTGTTDINKITTIDRFDYNRYARNH